MKVLKVKFSNLALFKEDLVIDFSAQNRISREAREDLIQITGPVYTNPVIELAGLNASGKTVTLRLLYLALDLLNGINLNSSRYKHTVIEMIKEKPIEITLWFYLNNNFYILQTAIDKQKSRDGLINPNLIIQHEELYTQNTKRVTKGNWNIDPSNNADQAFYKFLKNREKVELPDDLSIIFSYSKHNNSKTYDFICDVNHNFLRLEGDYYPEVIKFLDPSIERFDCNRDENGNVKSYSLKFVTNDKVYTLSRFGELENYLSSGTIKGISLFTISIFAFLNGGYVFVDELENHFNLEIVKTLIRFFLNKTTNHGGGTLVFSTHYPELLDIPPRNDAVYILKNQSGITCENLTKLLSRNDGIKRSEAFITDQLKGTAPSYGHYMNLKTLIKNQYSEDNKGLEAKSAEVIDADKR